MFGLFANSTEKYAGVSLIILIALSFGNALAGKLYKIVDENGKVTFSQFPPSDSKSKNDEKGTANVKVESIDMSSSSDGMTQIHEIDGEEYCGDIRLSSYISPRSSRERQLKSIDNRIERWASSIKNYEDQLESLTQRQFDRSSAKHTKKYESDTRKNQRYQRYHDSRNRIVSNLKKTRCALAWAKNKRGQLDMDEGLQAKEKELERLQALREKQQQKIKRLCGVEPPYDPTTEHGKARTQAWEECSEAYLNDLRGIERKIREAKRS